MSTTKAGPKELISVDEAQQQLREVLSRVSRDGDRIVVSDNGTPLAALVSMADLARLTALEGSAPVARVAEEVAPTTDESDRLNAIYERIRAENLAMRSESAALLAPPSEELIRQRRAVVAEMERHRPYRSIAPLTASDLIHEARAQADQDQ